MTLSSAIARWTTKATATPVARQASGSRTLGIVDDSKQFTDCNIFYGVTITANAASDVATLTISSGAVAQTTGTPLVSRFTGNTGDLSGVDFEGITLPTMVTLQGITLEFPTTNGTAVAVACSDAALPDITSAPAGGVYHCPLRSGSASVGTVAFTFAGEESVNVTVWGKTT